MICYFLLHHSLPHHYHFLNKNQQAYLLLPWNPSWFSRAFAQHHQVTQSMGVSPGSAVAAGGGGPCTGSYLGSDVVRRPTERGCRHTVQNPFLAHPKVGQLAVTFCIQKDVVQFQIPARWTRTTWLMLHSSQCSLLELERGTHLRETCYRKERLEEA